MDIDIMWKRGLAASWHAKNPVLAEGEPGFELDTHRYKVGNGHDSWRQLPYYLAEQDIIDLVNRLTSPENTEDQSNAMAALAAHIRSLHPHTAYEDDLPSFDILYQNAKV